jgi:hypothetical protein
MRCKEKIELKEKIIFSFFGKLWDFFSTKREWGKQQQRHNVVLSFKLDPASSTGQGFELRNASRWSFILGPGSEAGMTIEIATVPLGTNTL